MSSIVYEPLKLMRKDGKMVDAVYYNNADIVKDTKILEMARSEAINFVKEHNIDDYPLLKNADNLQSVSNLDLLAS